MSNITEANIIGNKLSSLKIIYEPKAIKAGKNIF